MAHRSRLSRNLERKSRKTLFLTLGGIILVVILIFKVGIPLLINLSLHGVKTSDTSSNQNKNTYVAVPILNYVNSATNSAQTIITGKAEAKETIKLYVNDSQIDDTKTGNNGVFSFDNVPLQKGDNTIKVKAVTENKSESDFSDPLTITYKEGKINLTIDSPSDNQTFSKDDNSVSVTGKTDSGNKVTVNGFWAIVDGNGNYSYKLSLQSGDNKIHVQASDDAGNTTSQDRKVTYNP